MCYKIYARIFTLKSHDDIAQTKDEYLEDARLERELTGDELMGLPNEDIGTVYSGFHEWNEPFLLEICRSKYRIILNFDSSITGNSRKHQKITFCIEF